jgi:phosphoglucomutase
VQASLLAVEAAAYYRLKGKTLLDALHDLYEQYGYYLESVKNYSFSGIEGMEKIAAIMNKLRMNPPTELSGHKVLVYKDYQTGLNYVGGESSPMDTPRTNMLYFEAEGDRSFIIRPSGTEPKIKLYFGVRGSTMDEAKSSMDRLVDSVVQEYM